MKALVTAAFHREGLEILKRHMEVIYESWRETGRAYWADELLERLRAEGVDVLIVEVDRVSRELMEGAGLKIVGCCNNNLRNVDVEAATDLGIPVFYAPHRNADAVADLTVGLIIAARRKIVKADRLLRSGSVEVEEFSDFVAYYNELTGLELMNKVVGIVGLGAIGSRVAKRLRAFGAKILVYDPYVPEDAVKEVGASRVDLETLMKESDIVTIHCSVTPETIDLIGEEEISLMKPTAYLFNLASSAVVDEDALYEALVEGRIAGAGLDVFSEEPIDSSNRFLRLDNVVVTPHIGGATWEVVRRHSLMVAGDIDRYLRGERPLHIANPEVLEGRGA